ncbi:AraC-like DNA-binding protein [Pedobacter cryoconitis]|uniref:AraC-like DNA-binding protein n=1 Tax=Pedobacter cryoconitis TaxID=188932 RepID=A0A7W9DWZ8_9SPHI|nr:AraC family transcriptional regulator [Pedobacter cryoconitis]MBB5634401.1 AraC-like DNA-binding protein [Pedobacter cryoconitis]
MKNQGTYNGYRIAVPVEFEEVFSHFYFSENKSGNSITHTLVPSFQTMMIFNFGTAVSFINKQNDEIEMGNCMIAGPLKQAVRYTLPSGAEMLVINFKNDAFFRFFGTALLEDHLHPDDLMTDNCFSTLWKELTKIDSLERKITHMLTFCRPFLQGRHPITEQIIALGNNGISPVKEISNREQLSERSVQMKLKEHLGYSSREMGRYTRFLKAIQLVQHLTSGTDQVNWFEVVEACGYYDQSQLIHDFKHYLNLSPSKYIKLRQGICVSSINSENHTSLPALF